MSAKLFAIVFCVLPRHCFIENSILNLVIHRIGLNRRFIHFMFNNEADISVTHVCTVVPCAARLNIHLSIKFHAVVIVWLTGFPICVGEVLARNPRPLSRSICFCSYLAIRFARFLCKLIHNSLFLRAVYGNQMPAPSVTHFICLIPTAGLNVIQYIQMSIVKS